MSTEGERPARIGEIKVAVGVPDGPRAGLLAVASHRTVHKSFEQPPAVCIELAA